jgi:molybdopterin-guanine dinucleotide biosynthesis protein A
VARISPNKNLNGLILAGGKSSRMGRDKSLIHYHGKPQRDHLMEVLKPFCDQVFISTAKQTKIQPSTIQDHFNLESPLNGILSAFHFDPFTSWITLPVDMPNIDSNAIAYLLSHRDKSKIATCFLDSDELSPEPLFTIWEPKAKPLLFDFFNSGEFSPKKFLIQNDVCLLKVPNSTMLININTEEELQAYLNGSS